MEPAKEQKKIGSRVVNVYFVQPTEAQKEAQVKAIYECIKDELIKEAQSKNS